MFNVLYNALLEWNRTSDDRRKMQHSYVVLIITVVIVAGLMSLFDAETGKDILKVAGVGIAIFLVNAIMWGFVKSVVVERLSGKHKRG